MGWRIRGGAQGERRKEIVLSFAPVTRGMWGVSKRLCWVTQLKTTIVNINQSKAPCLVDVDL